MKWFGIKEADISPGARALFEERGPDTVRALLPMGPGTTFTVDEDGHPITVGDLREEMQRWLKEQYDRAERRETWLITMEVAITFFVGAEGIASVVRFLCGK